MWHTVSNFPNDMQLGLFEEDYIPEGEVYELDGRYYKIKVPPFRFQEVSKEGSKVKFRVMDVEYDAVRIIIQRLGELKKVDNFPNEKDKFCQ